MITPTMTCARGFSPPKTSSSDGLKPINRLRPSSAGVRVISHLLDARFPLGATTTVIVIISRYATHRDTIAYYYRGNIEIIIIIIIAQCMRIVFTRQHSTGVYARRRCRRGVPTTVGKCIMSRVRHVFPIGSVLAIFLFSNRMKKINLYARYAARRCRSA